MKNMSVQALEGDAGRGGGSDEHRVEQWAQVSVHCSHQTLWRPTDKLIVL